MTIDPNVQASLDKIQKDFDSDVLTLKNDFAANMAALNSSLSTLPPPPTTSPSYIQFSRRSNQVGLLPDDKDKVRAIFVQADANGINLCKAVRSQQLPIDVYFYTSLNSTTDNDPNGTISLVPYSYATLNEPFFLHRGGQLQSNRVMYPGAPHDWLLNIGNPSVQVAAIKHLDDIIGLAPWAGGFFDNVWSKLHQMSISAIPSGVTDEWAFDSTMLNAYIAAINTIVAHVKSKGLKTMGNIAGNDLVNWKIFLSNSNLDSAEIESMTDGGFGIQQQVRYGFWQKTLQQIQIAGQLGKLVETHTYLSGKDNPAVSDRDAYKFYLASLCLAAEGPVNAELSIANNGSQNVYYPECDAVKNLLGTPVENYQTNGTMYSRHFLGNDDKIRLVTVTPSLSAADIPLT